LNPKGILEEAKFFGVQELIDKFQQIVDEKTLIKDENTPLTRKDVVKALIQTSNKSELRFQVLISFFIRLLINDLFQ
jgi:BTB/POZ domain-containing protein KCTD9